MNERSTYDIEVWWVEPEVTFEERKDITQTDAVEYLRSVLRSSPLGEETTIRFTRKIPA